MKNIDDINKDLNSGNSILMSSRELSHEPEDDDDDDDWGADSSTVATYSAASGAAEIFKRAGMGVGYTGAQNKDSKDKDDKDKK